MWQIDSFAEVNNMTEAANVGKEFLRGLAHKGKVIGAENETDTAVALPSHPFVEKLQNVKVTSSHSTTQWSKPATSSSISLFFNE